MKLIRLPFLVDRWINPDMIISVYAISSEYNSKIKSELTYVSGAAVRTISYEHTAIEVVTAINKELEAS